MRKEICVSIWWSDMDIAPTLPYLLYIFFSHTLPPQPSEYLGHRWIGQVFRLFYYRPFPFSSFLLKLQGLLFPPGMILSSSFIVFIYWFSSIKTCQGKGGHPKRKKINTMSTLDNKHGGGEGKPDIPEESTSPPPSLRQQQRQRTELSMENVNAKLANPLAGYTQRELIGMGGAYARDHGMEDLVDEFQKVGSDIGCFFSFFFLLHSEWSSFELK